MTSVPDSNLFVKVHPDRRDWLVPLEGQKDVSLLCLCFSGLFISLLLPSKCPSCSLLVKAEETVSEPPWQFCLQCRFPDPATPLSPSEDYMFIVLSVLNSMMWKL